MKAIINLLSSLIMDVIDSIDTMIVNATGILRGGGLWGNAWNDILQWIEKANIKKFCNIVIALCLLIEIAQVAAKVDTIKWEHGLKLCVKAALARVAMDVAPDFLRACYNQASIWINGLWAAGSSIKPDQNTLNLLDTALNKVDGLFAAIGLLATCLLAILAIKICGLLVMVIAYGRMFEIYVYLLISPLPFAFFPLGNGNGDGISRITQRFVKSFIAVCLQGVMILCCMRIFDTLMQNSFNSILLSSITGSNGSASVAVNNFCFSLLMGCIVLVMSISRCGTWAKGIIDAM